MLRCGQGLVLVATLTSLLIRPDSFSVLLAIPISMGESQPEESRSAGHFMRGYIERFLARRVGEEPCLLLFDEACSLFADVPDRLES
jgi:hypothetical protein